MLRKIPLFLLTLALLAIAVYLKSPIVAAVIVVLWGVQAGEAILTHQTREADIKVMMEDMTKMKARMQVLDMNVTNVAERAKTILGEVY